MARRSVLSRIVAEHGFEGVLGELGTSEPALPVFAVKTRDYICAMLLMSASLFGGVEQPVRTLHGARM